MDTQTGSNRMYANGDMVNQAIVNKTKIKYPGFPKYEKQFLVIGQFPRKFKGGFQKNWLLKGKLSQLNWWSYMLNDSSICDMASCKPYLKGDIIPWEQEQFTTNGLRIEQLDSELFCGRTKNLFFFPGKRTRKSAEHLCGAHGGSVVSPESPGIK